MNKQIGWQEALRLFYCILLLVMFYFGMLFEQSRALDVTISNCSYITIPNINKTQDIIITVTPLPTPSISTGSNPILNKILQGNYTVNYLKAHSDGIMDYPAAYKICDEYICVRLTVNEFKDLNITGD